MQTAVLHAWVVICKLSSLYVMSICSHPEKTSINSQIKEKSFWTAGIWQEEKVIFHASLWGAFSSKHIFASRRGQTSAVSVPFIFIESAMSAWWRGRVEMDHRGRIDETEENYSAFKTRFIKANGNLGTEYTFPAFTHDSTLMMWFFFLDVKILPRYSGRGTFRPHLSMQEFISLESHPETCCYDDYMTMPVHFRALQSGLVYQKYHKNKWTERRSLQHPFIKFEHCKHALITQVIFCANVSGRLLRTCSYTCLSLFVQASKMNYEMKLEVLCRAFQITGKLQLQHRRGVRGVWMQLFVCLSVISCNTPSQRNEAAFVVKMVVSGSINTTDCFFKVLNRH